jgi:hypothetical protein
VMARTRVRIPLDPAHRSMTFPGAGAAVGALLVSACVTDAAKVVSEQASSSVRDSAVLEHMAEQTGITALLDSTLARYRDVLTSPEVELDTVGVPLAKLAAGVVTGPRPPDLVGRALRDLAAEHGPAMAKHLILGAVTGGTGLITGLPAVAAGAHAAEQTLAAAQAAQAEIDAAYAHSDRLRAQTALVPDADRPCEAAALLEGADQPAGTRLAWHNPQTGARGSVELGPHQTGDNPHAGDAVSGDAISCRRVHREYQHGTVSRTGLGTICRQRHVWYDSS